MRHRDRAAVIGLLLGPPVLAFVGFGIHHEITGAPTGPEGDNGTTVVELVLRNGVRCASMDGADSKQLVCDWDGPRDPNPPAVDPAGDRGTTVTLVRLSDGRECAVMDGRGKGLSCEGMR